MPNTFLFWAAQRNGKFFRLPDQGSLTCHSSDCLVESKVLAEKDPELRRKFESSASFIGRVEVNRLTANASYICSRVAAERGLWTEALTQAKRCVQLNYRAWASIETRSSKNAVKSKAEPNNIESDISFGAIAANASTKLIAPVIMSTTHSSLNGSAFWSLVPSLSRGLINLSQLFARLGLFQEALYYSDQAQKIVEAVNAKPLIAENLANTGGLHIRAAQIQKGEDFIKRAEEVNKGYEQTKVLIQLHFMQGCLHGRQGNLDDEKAEYVHAEQAIQRLTTETFISKMERFETANSGLESKMASLCLEKTSKSRRRDGPQQDKNRQPSTAQKQRSQKDAAVRQTSPTSTECSELLCLRGNVLRLRAAVELLQRKPAVASSLLLEAESCPMDTQGIVLQRLGLSNQLLRQSLEEMSRDPVFCVVEESTISFPSVMSNVKKAQRIMGDLSPSTAGQHAEKSPNKTLSKSISRAKKPAQHSFIDVLTDAREGLLGVLSTATTQGSTATVWTLSSTLSSITVFLAAIVSGRSMTSIRPVMPMFYAGKRNLLFSNRQMLTIA